MEQARIGTCSGASEVSVLVGREKLKEKSLKMGCLAIIIIIWMVMATLIIMKS